MPDIIARDVVPRSCDDAPDRESSMMRKALVVGINHYQHSSSLFGCVDDAHAVKAILATHADGSPNFDVELLTGTGPTDVVTRGQLKDAVKTLFASKDEI